MCYYMYRYVDDPSSSAPLLSALSLHTHTHTHTLTHTHTHTHTHSHTHTCIHIHTHTHSHTYTHTHTHTHTQGEANRIIAEHSLNQHSSRSHCIFTIHVESRSRTLSSPNYTLSKLNLVDLAGSERLSKTNVRIHTHIHTESVDSIADQLQNVIRE